MELNQSEAYPGSTFQHIGSSIAKKKKLNLNVPNERDCSIIEKFI